MSKYAQHCEPYLNDPMSMDQRHAAAIGSFLKNIEPPAAVIEVGACYGVSTAAILDACEEADFSFTVIDTKFQESVKAMVKQAAGKVALVTDSGHSVAVLGDYLTPESIVLLDGDHRRAYMELESEVLERKPPRAIILHDVAAFRQHDCDGPAWLLHHWQAKGYRVAIDYQPRPGERTERGLAILCRDEADADVAMGVMCAIWS